MPDRISWFIDGKPVRFADWSADAVAHGGFRDFQGVAQGDIAFAEQEAPLAGFRRDGSPFWYGTMTLDPEVTEGGATIKAEGLFKGKFSTQTGRRFFMSRHEGSWKLMDAKPYDYPTPGDAPDYKVYAGIHKWTFKKNESVAIGDLDGAVFWVEGAIVTNLKADLGGNGATGPQIKYRIRTGFGPSGALTQEGADVSSAAASFDRALGATSGDIVNIAVRRDTNPTGNLAQTVRGTLKNIEVRGLATSSVFTLDEVLAVILALDERPPQVDASALDVMPLDWNGTDFDLAAYLTNVGDWWFMILDRDDGGTYSQAGPWDREVRIARRRNARTSLVPLRRYNRVRVPYRNTTDDERFALGVADPDPFPDRIVEFVTEPLEDPYPNDSDVPQSFADAQVKNLSRIRRSGTIEVAEAIDADTGKRIGNYELRPGVVANIVDHDPSIPPQRIEAVSWSAGGTAQATIEAEEGAIQTLRRESTGGKKPGHHGKKDGGRRKS